MGCGCKKGNKPAPRPQVTKPVPRPNQDTSRPRPAQPNQNGYQGQSK